MKQVRVDRATIDKVRNQYKSRTQELEVPELNEVMGLKEGSVATIKIKQLDLNVYLEAQGQQLDLYRNLIEGIVEAAVDSDLVAETVKKTEKKPTPMTKHRLKILKAGIIEPKLKQSDLNFLSRIFPNVILRIYNAIIELTNAGGIKKNSSD